MSNIEQFDDASPQVDSQTSDTLADELFGDLEKADTALARADQTQDLKTINLNGWNMHSPQRRLF